MIRALKSKMTSATKSFAFWFSNEQTNFRDAELLALCETFQINPDYFKNRKTFGPFIVMNLPSEDCAKKIMSRTVLAHHCIEMWASGDSMADLHQDFKNNINIVLPHANDSFCIRVETYGKKITLSEKIEFLETFDYLPIDGPVDLVNPKLNLKLFQFYGLDPNNVPTYPIKNLFGRWIADGQRHLVYKTSLKTRKFIGNTSMDPLLSILMTNLALVKQNDVVFDPFVGTGSLVVAAAMMGGFVVGADIDYLMLHARTRPTRAKDKERAKDESIRANFIQYGVENQYLDILVADAATVNSVWKKDFRVDAIITDPPYGIREPTERIGTTKNYTIKEEHVALHIPSKVDYSLSDIICDLVNQSAQRLTVGGRLVFWIPVSRDHYEEEKLPKHECFSLISNCEQVLTAGGARQLIVMQKICEPTESSHTVIDPSAPMYRFKMYEIRQSTTRRERKNNSVVYYGKMTKGGQVRE